MRSGIPLCHFIPEVPPSLAMVPQVVALGTSLPFLRINLRLTTHRAPTPLMIIEGRVQYQLALARLVPTRKLASQTLHLALRLMGMGAPTPGRLPPAKAGHLNRNLTHLAPRRIPSFPSHPVVILRGPTRDLKVPTRQAKLLLTRTPSLLLHTASPIPVPRPPRVLH
jgi:hypothetical protein